MFIVTSLQFPTS